MEKVQIAFLEKSDISDASSVLSEAMLNVPLHIAVFQGHGEKERKIIEKMFFELLSDLPGITFLAGMNRQIVGVMRMKSCTGSKVSKVRLSAVSFSFFEVLKTCTPTNRYFWNFKNTVI